jgi:hypothetical protein
VNAFQHALSNPDIEVVVALRLYLVVAAVDRRRVCGVRKRLHGLQRDLIERRNLEVARVTSMKSRAMRQRIFNRESRTPLVDTASSPVT